MRRRISWGVLLLTVLAFVPAALAAQDAGGDAPSRTSDSGFELQQNYPNPFNPTTRIPFRLDPRLFEQGRTVVVSMQVFNVLLQPVAVPTAMNHPEGAVRIDRLEYTAPGQYEAFWDGIDRNGRQVASGMYYLSIIVNGERKLMKMIVSK